MDAGKCKYCTEDDAKSTDPCTCKTDCGGDLCEAPDARQSWPARG